MAGETMRHSRESSQLTTATSDRPRLRSAADAPSASRSLEVTIAVIPGSARELRQRERARPPPCCSRRGDGSRGCPPGHRARRAPSRRLTSWTNSAGPAMWRMPVVPEAREMVDDQLRVVDDVVGENPARRHLRVGTVHHVRHPELVEQRRPLVAVDQVEQHHAVHPALGAPPAVGGDLVARAHADHPEQQRLAGLGQHAFDAGEQAHVVRLRAEQFGIAAQHDADGVGARPRQCACARTRMPPERRRQVQHPAARLIAHPRLSVQRVRDRRLRQPQLIGESADGDPAHPVVLPVCSTTIVACGAFTPERTAPPRRGNKRAGGARRAPPDAHEAPAGTASTVVPTARLSAATGHEANAPGRPPRSGVPKSCVARAGSGAPGRRQITFLSYHPIRRRASRWNPRRRHRSRPG